jgi:hypothetical protein
VTSSRRLDITVGLLAGGIAVLGLSISLLARNEDGGLFGSIARKDQASLLAVAVAVLGLTVAKAISARRR